MFVVAQGKRGGHPALGTRRAYEPRKKDVTGSTEKTCSSQKKPGPHWAPGFRKWSATAEGEGFEPPVPSRARWFSRPVHSTALPPLRAFYRSVALHAVQFFTVPYALCRSQWNLNRRQTIPRDVPPPAAELRSAFKTLNPLVVPRRAQPAGMSRRRF